MVRKMLSVLLVALLSFSTVFAMTAAAQIGDVLVDEATGVAYKILSSSTVDGNYEFSYEGKSKKQTAFYFHETVNGIGAEGIENEQLQAMIQKCKDEGEQEALRAYNSFTVVVLCPVMNQQDYVVPSDRLPYYYRLFGIDNTFSGMMTVEKEGIPFTVKGDGSGALTLQVKTNLQGKHTKTISIPFVKTYQSKEYVREHYTAVIMQRANPQLNDIISYDSLDKLLAHCAEHAVLDEPISISGHIQYNVEYEAFLTGNVQLEVEYGNESYVPLQPQTTTTAKKVVAADTTTQPQEDVAVDTTNAAVEVTSTTSTTTTLSSTTATTTQATTASPTTAIQASTTQSEPDESGNGSGAVVLWSLLPCGIAAAAAAVWYFRFYRKRT